MWDKTNYFFMLELDRTLAITIQRRLSHWWEMCFFLDSYLRFQQTFFFRSFNFEHSIDRIQNTKTNRKSTEKKKLDSQFIFELVTGECFLIFDAKGGKFDFKFNTKTT